MTRRWSAVVWLVVILVCWLVQPRHVSAAEVKIVAEPGVSEVLANEFKLVLDKTMEFYQTVFALTPVKPTVIIVAPDEASYAQVLQRELGLMPEQAVNRRYELCL